MNNSPAPMNGRVVNGHQPLPGESRSPAGRFRLAALVVVIIGVLALATAAFVLSYAGVRGTALSAGVTPRLARVYPMIFDGVLVVACAAAISLQGARWWLRAYAWLAVLVIVGAVAAADSVHAMAVHLPKRPIEATGAIVPWAVLLIGFTLLYAMARQAWPRRKPARVLASSPAAGPAALEPPRPQPPALALPGPEGSGSEPAQAADSRPAEAAQTADSRPAEPAQTADSRPAEPAQTARAAEPAPPAQATEPDEVPGAAPATEAAPATRAAPVTEPAATAEYPARTATLSDLLAHRAEPAAGPAAAGVDPVAVRHGPERDEPSDADAESSQHFNRLRSTPTPPEDHPWIVEAGSGEE